MNMTRVKLRAIPEEADVQEGEEEAAKRREYGRKWKETISERRALSVVLFQVCIRFMFQSIMFARSSLSAGTHQRTCLSLSKRDARENDGRTTKSESGGKDM